MPTYQEKWNAMSEQERNELAEQVGVTLTALIDAKHDIRLNDEFKEWAAHAMLHTITKNHATIHYFQKYCEENDLHTFDVLGICIKNYRKSVEFQQEKDEWAKGEASSPA